MDDFGDEASVLELWDREERTRDSGSDPGLFAGGVTARKPPRPVHCAHICSRVPLGHRISPPSPWRRACLF